MMIISNMASSPIIPAAAMPAMAGVPSSDAAGLLTVAFSGGGLRVTSLGGFVVATGPGASIDNTMTIVILYMGTINLATLAS